MSTPVFLSDLDPILEPTLIPYLQILKMNHLFWIVTFYCWEMNVNFNFFYLDQTLESNPILEPKLDLSQFYKSALVPVPIIPEPKSTTILNHILLLDQCIDSYDSVMIFEKLIIYLISYLCWYLISIGSWSIYKRWCSQEDQRLDGGVEGPPT